MNSIPFGDLRQVWGYPNLFMMILKKISLKNLSAGVLGLQEQDWTPLLKVKGQVFFLIICVTALEALILY